MEAEEKEREQEEVEESKMARLPEKMMQSRLAGKTVKYFQYFFR